MEAKYGSRHANSSQNLNKSPHFHIRNRGFFYKSIFEKVRIDFVKFSNQFGSEEMTKLLIGILDKADNGVLMDFLLCFFVRMTNFIYWA